MAGQERLTRPKPQRNAREEQSELPKRDAEKAAEVEKLKEDIDEVLDEIDELLAENAEEFVRTYVQRGGE